MSNYSVNYTVKNLNPSTISTLVARAYARVERQVLGLFTAFIAVARRIKAIRTAIRAADEAKAAEAFARLQRFLASSNVGKDTPTRPEVAATKARNAGPQIASPFTPQLKALKAARLCEQCKCKDVDQSGKLVHEPIWAMQYISDQDKPEFYLLGHHIRGFGLVRVCDACKVKMQEKAARLTPALARQKAAVGL